MRRVKSGESFSFPASEWNLMAEAIESYQKLQKEGGNNEKARRIPAGAVLVLNSTGLDVGKYSALTLSDVCIDPGEDGLPDFLHDTKYIVGTVPNAESLKKPFLITCEDIEAGDIGYALAYGVTPVEAVIAREEDEYLRPIAGTTGFESCLQGICRILWKGEVEEGSETRKCLVFLSLSGGSSGTSYSGMFCIDRDDENPEGIFVHNSDMPVSENAGVAFVNNQPFEVVKSSFTPAAGMSYVYLKFTPPTRETPEADAMPATAELTLETELKESDGTAQWYLIGSLSLDENGVLTISQDHRAGAIRMNWFGPCNLV